MALAAVPDIRALQVYLRGLADKSTDLRKASATAIASIRDKAAPVLDAAREPQRAAAGARARAAHDLRRAAPITAWRVVGPFPIAARRRGSPASRRPVGQLRGAGGKRVTWRTVDLADKQGQVDLGRTYRHDDDLAAYGYAEIESPSDRTAQMAVGSDDTLTVWLNGKEVYRFSDRRGFEHEQARFDVSLRKGINRVLIQCGNRGGPWQFAVAVTAPADFAFLKGPSGAGFDPEAYRAAAHRRAGASPAAAAGSSPTSRAWPASSATPWARRGATSGRSWASVASKYPRDELIASVLYPSAKISSGYEPEVARPRRRPRRHRDRPQRDRRAPSRSRTPTPSSSRSPRTTSTRASAATSR